jgi:hypothetical protein
VDPIQALDKIVPLLGPAGFAGLIVVVLLYFMHRILDSHTKMLIENSKDLQNAVKALEKLADSMDKLKDHIERRQT